MKTTFCVILLLFLQIDRLWGMNHAGRYPRLLLYSVGSSAQEKKGQAGSEISTCLDSAAIASRQGDYPASLHYYLKALKKTDDINNDTIKADTYVAMGGIFYRLGEYDQALEHLEQAEELYEKLQIDDLSALYYKKGIIYDEKPEQRHLAPVFLHKALTISRRKNHCSELADIYNALAGHYYMQKQIDSVAYYAKQALHKFEECGTPQEQAAMYINIAALLNVQKKHDEAVTYNKRGIELARRINSFPQLRQGYKNLSETYAYMGDFKNAYLNAEFYMQYKDSVISTEKNRMITEMTMLYETEKKERLLSEKQSEIERTKQHRTLFALSTVFALLLCGMLYVLLRQRRKRNRQLAEANATKDKLFSIISHDLKAPVIAQKATLDALIANYNAYETDALLDYLERFRMASESQMELLQNLLSWAQVQTGRAKFSPLPFDITQTIVETADLYAISAENKNIRITTEMPERCYVIGDRGMIATVLRNLINNAVKFSHPDSEIHISLVSKRTSVLISVKDSGTGMTEAQVETIRGGAVSGISSAGTQGEKGSGLGLIICKDFLCRNGSRLVIESRKGEGTRMSFELNQVNF